MTIQHSIHIDAPASDVWRTTLDVEALPEYAPTMTSVELLDPAPLAVGSRARIKQPLQSAKVWTVDILEPETRFCWSTTWLGVTMSATHCVEATTAGTTNTLTVGFDGRGARLIGLLMGRSVQSAIAKENHGLKSTVEAAASTS